MRRILIAAPLAALALVWSSAASATILVATYTGTVSSGFDQIGLFGAPDSSLAGEAYVARYTYDTSLGVHDTSLPDFDEVVGGGGCCGIASPISGTLTINGMTQSVFGTVEGFAVTEPLNNFMEDLVHDTNVGNNSTVDNTLQSFVVGYFPANIDGTLALRNVLNQGAAQFSIFNSLTGASISTSADLTGEGTVQIAVPEPSTWTLAILGLGGAGAMLRRRRQTAPAV